MKQKYLVRPNDYHIWELDESNNCYRSYTNRDVTYSNGIRPNANDRYTFEYLTECGFIPINENELKIYEDKNQLYCDWLNWYTRPDGHGGSKGGTMDEYLLMMRNKEK